MKRAELQDIEVLNAHLVGADVNELNYYGRFEEVLKWLPTLKILNLVSSSLDH